MTKQTICAFCESAQLTEIIDFGDMALAGAFLHKEQIPDEKKYPLVVVFCDECFVVQVRDHVDPEVLFETDFYFSSAIKTLRDHFAQYADEVTKRFLSDPAKSVVLEFGSNDGVLLRPLSDCGIETVIGVDPAKNIVESIEDDEGIKLVNSFFNETSAEKLVAEHGKVDLVMANNVFAHISDINSTTKGVFNVLKDEGVFIFEVHYLGKIIEELQYDFIYHEHIYYYSLIALQNHLERHGMVIFDIKKIPIHGGSIRYYVAKEDSKNAKEVSSAVIELQKKELELGYDKPETYVQFATQIAERKDQLMELIAKLKAEGKTIAGYGASGRANTIMQYSGITTAHLEYIVDDAPAKHGLYTPGTHIEIKDRAVLQEENPDYVLLLAWAFYREIAGKNQEYLSSGGQMFVPLPEVKMISE